MTKFKVGDEVILNKIENAFGDDQSDNYELPMNVRIRSIETDGGSYDYGVNRLDGSWLSSVFEKNLDAIPSVEVVKRVDIHINKGQLSVQHTTNSKRGRVGLLKQGRVMGHIRFEEIDTYIELLNKLKDESK